MPQNDEEIKYIVTAEDLASAVFDDVNDNLDEMDDKAAKAGAAMKFLADDVERMSPKFVSGIASSEKFKLSLAGIRDVADKFDQKVGPAAAAISSISSSLGNSGGKMGVLVDTLGQAAAAFAVAGPLGAGLVATTVAVDAYTASVAATEEAHKKFIEELKKVPEGLQKVWDSVTKAQELAAKYQEQAAAVGLENWEVEISNLMKEQTILEDTARAKEKEFNRAKEELRILEQTTRNVSNAMFSGASDDRIREMEKARAVVADLGAEYQKTKEGAEGIADSINKMTTALIEAENRKKLFGLNPVKVAIEFVPPSEQEVRDLLSSRLDFQGDPIAIQVDVDTKNQAKSNAVDAANQREEELKAIRLKAQRDELADVIMAEWDKADAIKQRQRDLQNELLAEKVQFIKDAYAADEAYFKNYAGAATQAVGIATSAFQGYLDAKIKGEENAELLMIASIMRVAGQSLIGSGIELIGEGVRNAMTPPLTPLGLAQIGTGSALVATGVGLGAAATGVEKFAGGLNPPTDDKKEAKTTTGVSTDTSSSRERDNGGSTINIIYNGMSGPTADNTARTLAKTQARAARRGLLTGA